MHLPFFGVRFIYFPIIKYQDYYGIVIKSTSKAAVLKDYNYTKDTKVWVSYNQNDVYKVVINDFESLCLQSFILLTNQFYFVWLCY